MNKKIINNCSSSYLLEEMSDQLIDYNSLFNSYSCNIVLEDDTDSTLLFSMSFFSSMAKSNMFLYLHDSKSLRQKSSSEYLFDQFIIDSIELLQSEFPTNSLSMETEHLGQLGSQVQNALEHIHGLSIIDSYKLKNKNVGNHQHSNNYKPSLFIHLDSPRDMSLKLSVKCN